MSSRVLTLSFRSRLKLVQAYHLWQQKVVVARTLLQTSLLLPISFESSASSEFEACTCPGSCEPRASASNAVSTWTASRVAATLSSLSRRAFFRLHG